MESSISSFRKYFVALATILSIVCMGIFYGGAFYNAFRIPSYALLLLAILIAIPSALTTRRNFSLSCILAVGFFFIYTICWSFKYQPVAWQTIGSYTSVLAIYLIFVAVINQSFYRLLFGVGFLAFAWFEVLIGLYQFVINGSFVLLPWLSEQLKNWSLGRYDDRAHGTYLNPNHYAVVLAVAGIYALTFVVWGKFRLWIKGLLLLSSLACMTGVLTSLSRGSWLATAGGLLIFLVITFIVSLQTKRSRLFMIIIFVFFGGIVAAGSYFLLDSNFRVVVRFDRLFDAEVRPELWEAAFRQFETSPFVGTGPGSYQALSRININRWVNSLVSDPGYTHNEYLQCLAEYGIIGIALLLLIIGLHIFHGLRELGHHVRMTIASGERNQNNSLALLIASLSAMTIWVIHAFFDSLQHVPVNLQLAAATLAILAGNEFRKQGATQERKINPLLWLPNFITTAGLITCGSLFIVFGFRIGRTEYRALTAENAIIQRNVSLALATSNSILQLFPNNAQYNYLYGKACMLAGDQPSSVQVRHAYYKTAQKHFQMAADLNPRDYVFWLYLAKAYDMTLDFDSAEIPYINAIERNPSFASVLSEYAKHYALKGDLLQAVRYAEMAEMQQPGMHYEPQLLQQYRERLTKDKSKN